MATLGMVALLVSLLTGRVLPVLAGRSAQADAAILRLQGAMVLLAALAWRQIEESVDLLDEMEGPARAMTEALRDVMAALARLRHAPPLPVRRRPRRRAVLVVPCPPVPVTSARARDGPLARAALAVRSRPRANARPRGANICAQPWASASGLTTWIGAPAANAFT